MKVRDLIKRLSKMPQDLEVYALEENGALEVNVEMDFTGCENIEDHHVTLYFEYFTPDSQEEDTEQQ